ncbi:N-acetylmuramoyl-L-alanine amidase [Arcticibacter sp.]|jgi:N-acetyl-anhydromuramyl-L-alanine amidase AmpD|uniref:N-acetylmuramoyl-L-alanine amidase n=1 Tax=Arcticibacter sp. TaxID=1872630 RepID=UPI003890BB85
MLKKTTDNCIKSLILSALLFSSCSSSTFRIFHKPIVFDDEREKLSIEYLESRHGIKKDRATIQPRMVVLHWTAIPDIERTFHAFYSPTLPEARKSISSASTLNVSSQFLIDRDGTIFQLLPDTVFARHVIGLNHCAIGVENVGSAKDPLTRAQLKANENLVRYLKTKYNIDYLIGHYEYQKFIGHELWKESDSSYLTVKTDPGKGFMRKIRTRLKDLNLKGAP